jgi:hypothetical protein
MAKLTIPVIMPILQEEWQRRQARQSDHKTSHLPGRIYMEDHNANNGKGIRIILVTLHKQVLQIITLVINLLHTTNLAKAELQT